MFDLQATLAGLAQETAGLQVVPITGSEPERRMALRIDAPIYTTNYEQLPWLTQTLRSSGRFVWPLLYAIELAVTLCVLRALRDRRRLASSLLIAALAWLMERRPD